MSPALGDLTWPQARRLAAAGAMLAVPVGSTEQHGPHLPLSTDTDVAVALAARLAARRADVVVAPPVGYGSSGEHAGFAGTISIGQRALELTLLELGRSAAETFGHILFVCAHGGNREPATRAAARLHGESVDALLWMAGDAPSGAHRSRGSISSAIATKVLRPNGRGRAPTRDAHAGLRESPLQLALHPGRVRMSRAEAGNRTPIAELMPLLRAEGVQAASRNGVLGDPSGASAAEGAELLAALTADLLAAVAAWRGPGPG
ncbi:MAG: mycofactocin biosynthesis peptidyl-dipeptidase MftE [Kitasatospora sp.]|nr:mycofactocin biosynthesis peptidyl-dipeptidase MftE [Kitasatospora sp.]